jgi:hypothetical protein
LGLGSSAHVLHLPLLIDIHRARTRAGNLYKYRLAILGKTTIELKGRLAHFPARSRPGRDAG